MDSDKKTIRRYKNMVSARKSRQLKKDIRKHLEETVKMLSTHNTELQGMLNTVIIENANLRDYISSQAALLNKEKYDNLLEVERFML